MEDRITIIIHVITAQLVTSVEQESFRLRMVKVVIFHMLFPLAVIMQNLLTSTCCLANY